MTDRKPPAFRLPTTLEMLTLSTGGGAPGARTAASYRPGPPPKFGDAFRASPVGRIPHEYVTRPAANLVGLLGAGLDRAGAFSGILGEPTFEPMWDEAVDRYVEQPYQAMLQRNRNTPGYPEARQRANAWMAKRGSGGEDQLSGAYALLKAGLGGFWHGDIDEMNARADALSEAMDVYEARHPREAATANLMGALGPPTGVFRTAGKIPARARGGAPGRTPDEAPPIGLLGSLGQEGADIYARRRKEGRQ